MNGVEVGGEIADVVFQRHGVALVGGDVAQIVRTALHAHIPRPLRVQHGLQVAAQGGVGAAHARVRVAVARAGRGHVHGENQRGAAGRLGALQHVFHEAAILEHVKLKPHGSPDGKHHFLNRKIIADKKYSSLDVICHIPLRALIKNMELLNEKEKKYVMNPATHLDFLIYNRTSKKPVLAIEVDGYFYHKEGTVQASRDLLKNHILELYKIHLLRFLTNGSNEREKIIEMLDKVIS